MKTNRVSMQKSNNSNNPSTQPANRGDKNDARSPNSKEDFDKVNQRSLVDDGDIIMPMIGTIGNPIVVKKEREFAIKNVALIKFFQDSKVDRYF